MYSTSFSSTIGKASMSARRRTTLPSPRPPRIRPVTPVLATPVRMSSIPSALQAFGHEAAGFNLLEAELRVFMQVAAVGDDTGQDFVDVIAELWGGGGHTAFSSRGSAAQSGPWSPCHSPCPLHRCRSGDGGGPRRSPCRGCGCRRRRRSPAGFQGSTKILGAHLRRFGEDVLLSDDLAGDLADELGHRLIVDGGRVPGVVLDFGLGPHRFGDALDQGGDPLLELLCGPRDRRSGRCRAVRRCPG